MRPFLAPPFSTRSASLCTRQPRGARGACSSRPLGRLLGLGDVTIWRKFGHILNQTGRSKPYNFVPLGHGSSSAASKISSPDIVPPDGRSGRSAPHKGPNPPCAARERFNPPASI